MTNYFDFQLLKKYFYRRAHGERQIRHTYRSIYGKELDLHKLKLFSEKLFARLIELNCHGSSLCTRLADKYSVRDYVSEKIGSDHLIDVIWSGLDPTAIPFHDLPSKCVIKTNHGSGGNIIYNRDVDSEYVIQTLRNWLEQNYYWVDREYQYYKIKPRILIEEYLDDGQPDGPLDYRFWCFHGKVEVIQIDNHAHDINPFYDVNWNEISLNYRDSHKQCHIDRPGNLDQMLIIASALSFDFDFVRVDLYNVHGHVYFGELTFTPVGGRCKLKPEYWDAELGGRWNYSPNTLREL
jgi:hypothetical protein